MPPRPSSRSPTNTKREAPEVLSEAALFGAAVALPEDGMGMTPRSDAEPDAEELLYLFKVVAQESVIEMDSLESGTEVAVRGKKPLTLGRAMFLTCRVVTPLVGFLWIGSLWGSKYAVFFLALVVLVEH